MRTGRRGYLKFLSHRNPVHDQFANNIIKGPGFMTMVAGEVVHIIKCIPFKVKDLYSIMHIYCKRIKSTSVGYRSVGVLLRMSRGNWDYPNPPVCEICECPIDTPPNIIIKFSIERCNPQRTRGR